jgi:putative acetyltransferase
MVILIGGTGCVGKTMLSNRLMHKLGVPYISADHIMMGIYRSNPDCGYTPMSKQDVIAAKLWPFLREVIKTNIENEHNIIIEGFQLLPECIHDFNSEYTKNIISIFLCFSKEYIKTKYTDIVTHRSAVEMRTDVDSKSQMIKDSVQLIEKCKEHNAAHFIITDNYCEGINKAENYVMSKFSIKAPR